MQFPNPHLLRHPPHPASPPAVRPKASSRSPAPSFLRRPPALHQCVRRHGLTCTSWSSDYLSLHWYGAYTSIIVSTLRGFDRSPQLFLRAAKALQRLKEKSTNRLYQRSHKELEGRVIDRRKRENEEYFEVHSAVGSGSFENLKRRL
ncbi:unnamed protein product [Calypogeia fissa]